MIRFAQLFIILFFISSCRTSINEEYPIINNKTNIGEKVNSEKKRIELKVSCGDDDELSEYINDGWIIIKKDTKEKICTWKSIPATNDCDMEKDKGCKITTPDKIGEEKTYLLEK